MSYFAILICLNTVIIRVTREKEKDSLIFTARHIYKEYIHKKIPILFGIIAGIKHPKSNF